MLEKLSEIPEGILAVKAVGKITREDYERVLEPVMAEAQRKGRRIRLLYQVGPEFEGLTPGATWEDAKLGLRSLRSFAGCAVVTDREWIRESTRVAGFFLPCPVRVFPNKELGRAIEWLGSLPQEVGLSHRLLPERGVLVIEPKHALTVQDFDALALAVDPWIESHGTLQGVVIAARAFPGWDTFGSVIRHIRFVRDHHQNIKRVALAVDGKLAGVVPRIGEHFLRAEVRAFALDQLDAAISWAGGENGKHDPARAGASSSSH